MLSKLKEGISTIKEKKSITIPITADLLNGILKRYRIEAIDRAEVAIEEGLVKVSGTTNVKKLGFTKELDFSLHLKPVNVEKRTLQLELVEMKPLNFNAINNKLLQRPPVITYENKIISVDLNTIDIINKVPVGNVKQFTVEDSKILVEIGL